MTSASRLAWFVSPHGFGHAARSAAIVEALGAAAPGLAVDFWTSVPEWFFAESISRPVGFRPLACDVGLVQRSPIAEDLEASLAALERFWAWAEGGGIDAVAAEVRDSGAVAVVADIAPFGLAVARAAGLPSVLIENFTWDWIYEPLVALDSGFGPWTERLASLFADCDRHLQLTPCCRELPGAVAVPPVARRAQGDRGAVRDRLAVPPGDALVLVSFGGVAHRLEALAPLAERRGITFVLPGASDDERAEGNLRLLPHRSPVHHPDLVAAADLVVGKLGYSTVAEAVAAGSRMLYVPRPGFRESAVLEAFVEERLPSRAISPDSLADGSWVEQIPALLALPPAAAQPSLGAEIAAAALGRFLASLR